MAIPHADKLIERAHKGEKLTTKERRHCVHYLIANSERLMTNEQMGELFQVSERQIRFDRKYIREERANSIKEDDVGLVVADIALHFERQLRDVEKSKNKCTPGSRTYLEHCKVAHDLQLKTIQALQNLGFYPKNLGNMTVQKFDFQALITQDGSIESRPVSLLDDEDTKVIEPAFQVEQGVQSVQTKS